MENLKTDIGGMEKVKNIILEIQFLKVKKNGKKWSGKERTYEHNKLVFECEYLNGERIGKGKEYFT